mmetsp:Transcript_10318/g.20895  ORF Transcript_10318/g.20895 Transcript_10318/m.20895 type:complete len:82 (+) Transcript_10318:163-408(+)
MQIETAPLSLIPSETLDSMPMLGTTLANDRSSWTVETVHGKISLFEIAPDHLTFRDLFFLLKFIVFLFVGKLVTELSLDNT